MLIETAFAAEESRANLDDYDIDFTGNMQISKKHSREQLPVKTVMHKRDDKYL